MSAALQLWGPRWTPPTVSHGGLVRGVHRRRPGASCAAPSSPATASQLGVEACAEATAWAWANRDRLLAMANPVGYLYRVGQTAVRNETRFHRAPLFPRRGPRPRRCRLADPGLHEALTRLTPDQRAAVMLVHAHGYRYAEAADLLDIPVSTLKNHLHRGSRRLRKILEQPIMNPELERRLRQLRRDGRRRRRRRRRRRSASADRPSSCRRRRPRQRRRPDRSAAPLLPRPRRGRRGGGGGRRRHRLRGGRSSPSTSIAERPITSQTSGVRRSTPPRSTTDAVDAAPRTTSVPDDRPPTRCRVGDCATAADEPDRCRRCARRTP